MSLIKDGHWHTLEEVTKKAKLPKPKTHKILEFLTDYNFVDFDGEQKKVKVTTSLLKFLRGAKRAKNASSL